MIRVYQSDSDSEDHIIYDHFRFPVGEDHVKIPRSFYDTPVHMMWDIKAGDINVMEFLLLCDAIKRYGGTLGHLTMPYVPFSRQDRVMVDGEPFSLKVFCDLINGVGFECVKIYDPHSDVTPALLNNCRVIPQHVIFGPILGERKRLWLLAPDGGALKKTHRLAMQFPNRGVMECSKIRLMATGEIIGVKVHGTEHYERGDDIAIVDDICDGGATFVAIAKVIRRDLDMGDGKLILAVTHGFFTRGLSVFDGLIDEIYTREGQIK